MIKPLSIKCIYLRPEISTFGLVSQPVPRNNTQVYTDPDSDSDSFICHIFLYIIEYIRIYI